ncbi:MAG: arylesterase [Pseudomonadota bacterium]
MQDCTWSKIFRFAVAGAASLALAACGGETAETPVERAETGEIAEGELAIPVMGPQRRIVAFGDSLFAGYGLAEGEGYPERLEAALRARGVNADVVDAGVPGDTSAAGRQRLTFALDALEEKPDLFILELGGNDLLRGLSPDETRANFVAMLDELKTRDIPVLLMGMRSPPNYGEEFRAQFDAMYGELAQEYDAALIPFWLEDIYRDPNLFQSDRIHPTAEGIEILVESTLAEVSEALPEPEVAEVR